MMNNIHFTVYYCEAHLMLLFCSNGGATDRHGTSVDLFEDVRTIISELESVEIKIAAASS